LILIAAALAARPFDRRDCATQASTAPLLARSFAPLRDPNVQRVLALALISATATPLFAKSALHFAEYVLQDAALARGATVAIGLGHLAGAPLWIFAARRFGAEKAFLVAHMIAGVSSLPLLAGGVLSETDFAAVAAAHAIGSSGVFILIWPLTAAAADDRTKHDRASSAGAVFGLAIMAMQIGAGLGSALLGAGLSAVGFEAGVAATPQVQSAIATMAALGPALGAAAIGVAIVAGHSRRRR
jgi:Na+/melibiose symporter-like transporter